MNDRGRKHLRRSERVRDLATSLKSAFPEGSKGAASIAKITQLIEHIKTLDTSSVTNAREIANVSGAKGDARKELVVRRGALGDSGFAAISPRWRSP